MIRIQNSARASPSRSGCLFISLLRGGFAGLFLAAIGHFASLFLIGNVRTVVLGEVYRSNQPDEATLHRLVRRYGIRTVINLRGTCPPAPWYQEELRVCGELGLSQHDIGFSAGRLPGTEAIRQLVWALERSERPILLHCQQGADRTGLASVMFMLLCTDAPYREARSHLNLATGHLPFGRTRHIDRFFALYEDWLRERGADHSREQFRVWAMEQYCPAEGRARVEVLEPLVDGVGRPTNRLVRLRVHNTSIRTWRFRPGSTEGLSVVGVFFRPDLTAIGGCRAGLFHRDVPPGEFLELAYPLPALAPGRYQLLLDIHDAQHSTFHHLGNELTSFELEVRP